MLVALRVLALLNALALALPPGWCCLPPEVPAQAAPPAPAPCCHHPAERAPQPAPPKEQPPCQQKSGARCCCELTSVTPPAQQQFTPDLAASVPLILLDLAAVPSRANSAAAVASLFSTPSLHVLQCVWRC